MELGTIEEVELIVDQIASNQIPPPNKAQVLVVIRQMVRMAKQVEAQAKEIAELRYGNAIKYGTSHPEMYKTELDYAKEEIERLQHNYHSACRLIADMHYAAVGEIMGAKVGVVEDVAAMKANHDNYKALCDQMAAALEAMAGYGNLFRTSSNQVSPYHLAVEALTAWREIK